MIQKLQCATASSFLPSWNDGLQYFEKAVS